MIASWIARSMLSTRVEFSWSAHRCSDQRVLKRGQPVVDRPRLRRVVGGVDIGLVLAHPEPRPERETNVVDGRQPRGPVVVGDLDGSARGRQCGPDHAVAHAADLAKALLGEFAELPRSIVVVAMAARE